MKFALGFLTCCLLVVIATVVFAPEYSHEIIDWIHSNSDATGETEITFGGVIVSDEKATETDRPNNSNGSRTRIVLDSVEVPIQGRSEPNVDANEDYEINIEEGGSFPIQANPNRVATNPSYSDFIRASNAMNKLKNRATELRAGLEFPRNTFAVDRKRGILIAHKPDGTRFIHNTGMPLTERHFTQKRITFEKRGDLWILTHYDP